MEPLGAAAGFPTLEPSGRSSQEGTGHILVASLWLLDTSSQHLAPFLLRCSILIVPSLVPCPGFPILDVPSWSHLAEVSREGQDTS